MSKPMTIWHLASYVEGTYLLFELQADQRPPGDDISAKANYEVRYLRALQRLNQIILGGIAPDDDIYGTEYFGNVYGGLKLAAEAVQAMNHETERDVIGNGVIYGHSWTDYLLQLAGELNNQLATALVVSGKIFPDATKEEVFANAAILMLDIVGPVNFSALRAGIRCEWPTEKEPDRIEILRAGINDASKVAEKIKFVVAYVRQTGEQDVTEIAAALGVHPKTLNRWKNSHGELAAEIQSGGTVNAPRRLHGYVDSRGNLDAEQSQ
ncbi:hypothetical protein [Fuerstiella marisgermanici]|uniref:Uncharacterized protein n=1 Tax=Fuerstiella marisgermanici TaxID=1891926 RepID=A0A1P8WDR7_9PLAN|nr:hypothetical protein [Fuerstiella marisgermanici]APZ92177.1 hypothetical protein Fuma_01785 [Fuerstiella marisgermanici]